MQKLAKHNNMYISITEAFRGIRKISQMQLHPKNYAYAALNLLLNGLQLAPATARRLVTRRAAGVVPCKLARRSQGAEDLSTRRAISVGNALNLDPPSFVSPEGVGSAYQCVNHKIRDGANGWRKRWDKRLGPAAPERWAKPTAPCTPPSLARHFATGHRAARSGEYANFILISELISSRFR